MKHRARPKLRALETRLAPATFTVTNTADVGAGSLRQAILSANTLAGADTVVFDASVFATQKSIALTGGTLVIADGLTVTGPAAGVKLVGNKASRVIQVNGAGTFAVSLTRLLISDGNAGASSGGGGLDSNGQNVTLTACSITGCVADDGGGIRVAGAAATSLVVVDSTISGNQAAEGGGIFTGFAPAVTVTVRNSTISGNTANNGGGIVSQAITVQASTITGNSASSIGGGLLVTGGAAPTASLETTVVSGNTAPAGGPDIYRQFSVVSVKTSAIGSASGFTISDKGGNLAFGFALKLGALADNGGLTESHLPAFDSPLVGKGSNPGAANNDQRGNGYPRVLGNLVDIGAVEVFDTVVRNTNDTGPGSLRQLISHANSVVGDDTLTFDPTVFGSAKTITLTSGVMLVLQGLTIQGPGSNLVTVTRTGTGRILDASLISAGAKFNLGGLTISKANSTVVGGGLAIGSASATLTDVAFRDNFSVAGGGGLFMNSAAGSLSLTDCTFDNNTTDDDGAGLSLQAGTLTITRCTFSNNRAVGRGGGVFVEAPAGAPAVRNSTFSANEATLLGGGLALVGLTTPFSLSNCTLVDNRSDDGAGGGIARTDPGGSLSLVSTVVSGNIAMTGPDISSPGTVSINNCAIGTAAGFTPVGASNLFGAALKLGPLADNGGLTKTHLPANDSPLVDAGSNLLGLTTDQRGAGFPRDIGAGVDIGAAETRAMVVRNPNDAGAGSLRQVLASADAVAGPDTVTFDPAVFAVPRTITLTSAILAVASAVTVQGPGAGLTTVDGNGLVFVFSTAAAPPQAAVGIAGLTLTGALLGVNVDDEALTLTDCVVTGNKSLGGIVVNGGYGSLTLERCAVTNNTGGGVRLIGYVYSPAATIRDTTISGNTAAIGGGLYAKYAADLFIERSTISGNQATAGAGGGVFSSGHSAARNFTVRNSTISGNSAATNGGGLAMVFGSAPVTLQNCTLTANSAGSGSGGGISASNSVDLTSCIVSGNVNAAAPDIANTGKTTVNFSAIGDSKGFTLTGANNLPFGATLKLGPLAANGGPTPTHALLPGSPAIDAGSNPVSLTNDQRGAGFVRVFNGKTDIGAFEAQPPAKVSAVTINGGATQRSRVTVIAVTFDVPPALPANPADAFQLRRQSDNAAVTLAAVAAGNTVTLTFTGGAVESGSLADGRYTLTAFAALIPNLDGNGDGAAGDNFVLIGDPATNKLFRLFGDADGDGDTDAVDYGAFRPAFGGATNLAFDFDGDGDVDAVDYGQFRIRFGSSV